MAESIKEQLFEAWRDWDLELENPAEKQADKDRLNELTDQYKKETGSSASRTLVRFYLREEYAEWRLKND